MLEERKIRQFRRNRQNSIYISALTGRGVQVFLDNLSTYFEKERITVNLFIPQTRNDLVNIIYEKGHVIERKDLSKKIHLLARVNKQMAAQLQEYIKKKRKKSI